MSNMQVTETQKLKFKTTLMCPVCLEYLEFVETEKFILLRCNNCQVSFSVDKMFINNYFWHGKFMWKKLINDLYRMFKKTVMFNH